MAQSVKLLTLDFGSGHDLRVHEFKPHVGSVLTMWSLLGILFLSLSLSLKNKEINIKKTQKNKTINQIMSLLCSEPSTGF